MFNAANDPYYRDDKNWIVGFKSDGELRRQEELEEFERELNESLAGMKDVIDGIIANEEEISLKLREELKEWGHSMRRKAMKIVWEDENT